jgi:hypothetical protein
MISAGDLMRQIMDILQGTPTIRIVLIDLRDGTCRRLDEGKWINGRFPKGIRLDQPTHVQGVGQPHGHVYGRKEKELVVVNLNGTSSHGSKGKLHPDDADALKAQGFTIRPDRIVEWRLTAK